MSFFPSSSAVDFGRDVTGRLAAAEAREWLCVNGIGGFAAGTVAAAMTGFLPTTFCALTL